MRDDRPSLTAAFVAFARGVGTNDGAIDPAAADVLPWPVGRLVGAAHRGPLLRPALRGASLGMIDHITLRMAAIDDAVRQAVSAGTRQLVLLGAGLDVRAWRMDELADVAVFEVDHPATQAFKRRQVQGLKPRARDVRFVPVNFERTRLEGALAAAGHDPAAPTVWVWEGVTMYLQRVSVISTLGEVRSCSAAGSRIALTYALPELVPFGGEATQRAAELAFRTIGEPMIGALPSSEVRSLLAGASFRVESDTDSTDWARQHRSTPALPLLFRAERLAVASHDGG